MGNLKRLSLLTSLITLLGTGSAYAADIDYGDYDERIYKDRSYIDKSLDDYEKRTRHHKHGYDEQYDNYADLEKDEPYSEKQYDQGSLKDNPDDEYAENQYSHRRHKRDSYNRDSARHQCRHPGKIRRELTREGWHDFKFLNQGPFRIRMIATNHNGRRFRMVINRCSGYIVRLRPLRRYWGHRQRARNYY